MSRTLTTFRARAAFTLIELLVVVAIIALLVAVLLPSLSAAREQAKRAVCLSNLNALGKAWPMYFDETRDRLPRNWNPTGVRDDDLRYEINYGGKVGRGDNGAFGHERVTGPDAGAPRLKPLNQYLGLPTVLGGPVSAAVGDALLQENGADVFRCPSDKGTVGKVRDSGSTSFDFYGTSYETNGLMIGRVRLNLPPGSFYQPALYLQPLEWNGSDKRLVTATRASFSGVAPSDLALMGDGAWFGEDLYPNTQKPAEWHGKDNRQAIGFMDGHAGFVTIENGYFITEEYNAIPFRDVLNKVRKVQHLVNF